MKKGLFLIYFIFSCLFVKSQCQADFQFQVNNLTVNFQDSSSYSPSTPVSFNWDFGNGNVGFGTNPTHTYNTAGTYNVCLTISDSTFFCYDTICKTVIITAQPPSCMASFSHNVGQNNNVSFVSSVSGGSAPYSYSWNFGDNLNPSFLANPTHQYLNNGAYIVTLSITDANNVICAYTDTVDVNYCSANFSFQVSSSGAATFTNTSIVNPGASPQYIWDFGDGSSSSQFSPTHNYQTVGSYTVTLTLIDSLNSCFNQKTDTVVISSLNNCRAGFTYSITNGTVTFQNTSNTFTSIQYDFGDSSFSSSANPTYTYSQSGTYIVCQTINDSLTNCSNTFCDTIVISISPPCQAGFTYSTQNEALFIQDQASNYTSISYIFGDGTSSNQANPTHFYMQSGNYSVCQFITNANGCSDTLCVTVQINIPPPCNASFAFSINRDTVQFQNLASNYTSIFYNFGDNSTSTAENPSHTYAQNGSYVVCQTVTDSLNNCTDTFCDTIVVSIPAPCDAGFSYSFMGDTVLFQNQGISFNRLIYRFGDGDSSSQIDPIHAYQSSGTYYVEQEVFNDTTNCSDIFYDTLQVTVSFSCKATFLLALDTNQVGTLFLVNTSSNDNSHQYFWDFGDGSTSTLRLPNHQFAKNQAYKICLTVYDTLQNCTSTYCDSVGLDSSGNILKTAGFKLTVLEGASVGLSEIQSIDGATLFPNPFKDWLTIQFEKPSVDLQYELLDNQGRLIKSDKIKFHDTKVQVGHLPKGIYYVRLFDSKSSTIKKVIKY